MIRHYRAEVEQHIGFISYNIMIVILESCWRFLLLLSCIMMRGLPETGAGNNIFAYVNQTCGRYLQQICLKIKAGPCETIVTCLCFS